MSRYTDADKLKRHGKGDLFSKSLWRMGMHDTNVRPRTMADTSTNDVEPVILGTWLATDKSKLLECSRCGETIFFESTVDIRRHYRYCHRCGAKMDEEKQIGE